MNDYRKRKVTITIDAVPSMKYEGKSIIICNAVALVFLLAALVVLRRWRMRGFIVIISAQV